jgi:hypothetical protein
MKIKKNTFSTLVLELFFPSILNCENLKIQVTIFQVTIFLLFCTVLYKNYEMETFTTDLFRNPYIHLQMYYLFYSIFFKLVN